MSNPHEVAKDAIKLGSATTDKDQTFKKTYQTVDRPATTDHDFHEDLLKSPPQNVPTDPDIPVTSTRTPGSKEGAYEVEPLQEGVLGHEETGRIKKSDVQGSVLNESSVHP
ncbi:hypothetical protein BV22DRAFT_1030756 [Leucogyrophana mollusca]|uniref:Uncharacterized protein n=1 Tax=Leucogyrophana mollusca TaxID=85980 RepID=A0ACB8BSE6_9AGAM|nr:hypothetical protein BV22DRAFT_1030756 [Leucogyrophana mollusca]